MLKTDERSATFTLICALLFICYKVLQKNHAEALIHLQHALPILFSRFGSAEIPEAPNGIAPKVTTNRIDSGLVEAFIRLDLHASAYASTRIPNISLSTPDSTTITPISNLNTARNQLINCTHRQYAFLRSTANQYRYFNAEPIPLPTLAEAQAISALLAQWSQAFEHFLANPSTILTPKARQGVQILKTQHLVVSIEAQTCLYLEESLFDQFASSWSEIIFLANEILSSTTTTVPTSTYNPNLRFSLDMAPRAPAPLHFYTKHPY